MPRLRSAVQQKQRPSSALLYKPNPNGKWKKIDYLLQEAFITMDSETCSICKNPIWLCHSTDSRIEFKVKAYTCYAEAELEAYKKLQGNKELGAGEYLVAKPIGIEYKDSTDPLPPRHEAYQRMQQ